MFPNCSHAKASDPTAAPPLNCSGAAPGDRGSYPLAETEESLSQAGSLAGQASLSVLLALLTLATALANAFVIATIWLCRKLHSPANYLIGSLAVTDLLVSVLVMPLCIVYTVSGRWTFGPVVCDVWLSSDITFCTASILHLCVIALDRYWAITDAVNYAARRTWKRAGAMIAVVWVISVSISLPPFFWRQSKAEEVMQCVVNTDKVLYTVYSVCGAFYVPTLVLILLYGKIYHAARSRILLQHHHQQQQRPSGHQRAGYKKGTSTVGAPLGRRFTMRRKRSQVQQQQQQQQEEEEVLNHHGRQQQQVQEVLNHRGHEQHGDGRCSRGGETSAAIAAAPSATAALVAASSSSAALVALSSSSAVPSAALAPAASSSPAPSSREDSGVGSSPGGRSLASSSSSSTSSSAAPSSRLWWVASRRRGSSMARHLLGRHHPARSRLSGGGGYDRGRNSSGGDVGDDVGGDVTGDVAGDAAVNVGGDVGGDGDGINGGGINGGGVSRGRRRCGGGGVAGGGADGGGGSGRTATSPTSHWRTSPLTRHKRATRVTRDLGGSPRPGGDSVRVNVADAAYERRRIAAARERKATTTLGVILGAFIVCWLPFFLASLILPLCQPRCSVEPALFDLFTWLGYLNSLINPVIYTWFNEDFKQAFQKLIRCKQIY